MIYICVLVNCNKNNVYVTFYGMLMPVDLSKTLISGAPIPAGFRLRTSAKKLLVPFMCRMVTELYCSTSRIHRATLLNVMAHLRRNVRILLSLRDIISWPKIYV